jgi:hypothetical protein
MPTAELTIGFHVPTDNKKEVIKYIKELLQEYAESNDGSEFLVNLAVHDRNVKIVPDEKYEE